MATTIIQTNFTTGELSPEASGRVDIAKYQNAAKLVRNVIVQVLGGAKGRGGLRYVSTTKFNGAKQARLIPYIFNRVQAYVLELGDSYMRVYDNTGAQVLDITNVPYEITTPYIESMLFDLNYAQGADTMFIAHQQVPINRLRRLGAADWRLGAAPFSVLPFDEIGHRPATTLTLSAATVGIGRAVTAGISSFLTSDVGRLLVSGGGVAKITAVSSGTVATADITSAFASTSIASTLWTITGSPQAAIYPSAKDPVGASITLTAQPTSTTEATHAITGISHDGVSTVTVTDPGHGYSSGNTIIITGISPAPYNGTYTIGVVNANMYNYTLAPNPGPATVLGNANRSVNNTPNVWRAADIGKYISINGGLVQITQITSLTVAVATVVTVLSAVVVSPPNAWVLEGSVWNDIDGYPGAVSLYQQRLIAGGSPDYPDVIWLSSIGDTLDFQIGINDSDATSFTVFSDQINPIVHLVQTTALMAMTYGGEFSVAGGIEKPITPTNVQVKNQSVYGCSGVRPVRIGSQVFFMQRDGIVLRAASYQALSDSYVAANVSKLSKHLLASPIVDMAYQQSPYSAIWLVRADGLLLSLVVDAEESVLAWSWHDTDGDFESVTCIPGADGLDQVWVIVRRDVNGQSVRYVERIDDSINTDACVTGTSVDPVSVWGGFGHLIGKTVSVVADGVPLSPVVVSNAGDITLSRPAKTLQAGLQYIVQVDMLTPEMVGPAGSAQGNNMRINEITGVFYMTVGCKVNGDYLPFQQLDTPMLDTPVAPFTGEKKLEILGWERGTAEVSFVQDQPMPFQLLSVIRKFTSNG